MNWKGRSKNVLFADDMILYYYSEAIEYNGQKPRLWNQAKEK